MMANLELRNPVFLFYPDLAYDMVFCIHVEPSPALAISKSLFGGCTGKSGVTISIQLDVINQSIIKAQFNNS